MTPAPEAPVAAAPRTPAAWEERLAPVLLGAALVAGLALRLGFAWRDDGIYWPDEIYQTLEPAHRAAFGYGLIAWEFIEGARSWALPGLIAFVFKLTAALGFDRPQAYLRAVRLLFCLSGVATAFATAALCRNLGARRLPAALAATAFALMGLSIYYGPRAMSESAAVLPLVAGLALTLKPTAAGRALVLGAALLGLAAIFRLQCAVVGAGVLALLLLKGRPRAALTVAGVLALGTVAYGGLDALTWGDWFHSAKVYLRFNLIEGKAAQFGVSPPSYYTGRLLASMGALWVLLAGLSVLALRRARGLWLLTATFFLLHVFTPHKELRFIYPVLPLVCALAGLGVDELLRGRWPGAGRGAALALGVTAVVSAVRFPTLTFEQLGTAREETHNPSALDAGGAENRLLLIARDRKDLCGLKVTTRELFYVGGYSYLHRQVPLYPPNTPERPRPPFNYLIAARGSKAGEEVAVEGEVALVRLPNPGCAADPGYDYHLD